MQGGQPFFPQTYPWQVDDPSLRLVQIQGQHTRALNVQQQRAPCSTSKRSGQTGLVAGQTGFTWEPDEDPTNTRPGGTPSGQAHLGLP